MKKNAAPDKPIQVTQCCLPPLDNYIKYVSDIFASHTLTNNGKYVTLLTHELKSFLDVPCISLCTNGTLALQLVIRLFGLNGKKVITTPFTYVATLSALLWEGCDVIFADIDSSSLCIDPRKVEECLQKNPDTAAILPVHVYGNACDVDTLATLSQRYKVPLIYDAAHAFGSRLYGKSLFNFGDAAIASFHATKLFHSVEGGAVITQNPDDSHKLRLLEAFGHIGDEHKCLGINAKMSELHAAMGLALLPMVGEIIEKRSKLVKVYDENLQITNNPLLHRPLLHADLDWNNAYYPVVFSSNSAMVTAMTRLAEASIFPRRYFYPSLTKLPYVKSPSCPIAEDISERILCLPLWADMQIDIAKRIAAIITNALENFR